MQRLFTFLLLWVCTSGLLAQEMPIAYDFGEKYNDRYKYSRLLTLAKDGNGGYVGVRQYFQGLILRPRGYYIEQYNAQMELVSEYNYKLRDADFVDGYMHNGQLHLLFLSYDYERGLYTYSMHRSSIDPYQFKEISLVNIRSEELQNPLDEDHYHRKFKRGLSTAVFFDREKRGFVIHVMQKKGRIEQHKLHYYNADLNKLWEKDYTDLTEKKNFAFEQMAIGQNPGEIYLVGKAHFKKKRFQAKERKFQYEMLKFTPNGVDSLVFDQGNKHSEGLYPLMLGNRMVCVGFYADRPDKRFNGLSFFEIDPLSMHVRKQRYNPFTEEFMADKFGREEDQSIKNLIFKGAYSDREGNLLFNAEEYFVTRSMHDTGAGQRVMVDRFHHNDIISAKLSPEGELIWARNINKSEVTQNDGAYASYGSYQKEGKTYFFISTASENPQLIGNDRLMFKQGLSRNRNLFVICLDESGRLNYEKVIDGAEARLPLMVSKPLDLEDQSHLLFYAKRGSKKQLVMLDISE